MSTATDRVAETQEQFVALMANWQKPVIEAVNRTAVSLDGRLPPLPNLPFPSQMPSIGDVVRNQFSFAEKLLEAHRRLALSNVPQANVRKLRIDEDSDEPGYYWVEND